MSEVMNVGVMNVGQSIYKASEVILIFLAGERTDGRTKVFQEVLADLKITGSKAAKQVFGYRCSLEVE